ncbi:hypothetical protein BLNAU_19025 [Blattamonas nauphoetae]|uniref:Uncharacterized protein n=1 Tax=Blattamonas nauphoetae TaxID=2049346 RepID=A0ABQ9X2R7_9EUKA|nr:hypothetical protein BLNAU_19025 [Blattamonas nauphoetae]
MPLSIHPIAFPASPVNINVGLVNYTDLSHNRLASIRLGEEFDDYLGLYDRQCAEVAHADQCHSPRDSSKACVEPTLLPHFVKEPGHLSYLDFAFLSGASRLSDAEIVRTIAASSRAIAALISAVRPSPPTSETTSSSDGSSDVDSLIPVPVAPGRTQPVSTVTPEVQDYIPSPVDSVPLSESSFPSPQILSCRTPRTLILLRIHPLQKQSPPPTPPRLMKVSQLDREMEEDEDEVSDGWMERQDVVQKDRLRASEFTHDDLRSDPFLHILLD